jgi:hypothetical protein
VVEERRCQSTAHSVYTENSKKGELPQPQTAWIDDLTLHWFGVKGQEQSA